MHKTEDAIQSITKALRAGAHVSILKQALLSDGFKPERADIIIRWASQSLRANPIKRRVRHERHNHV